MFRYNTILVLLAGFIILPSCAPTKEYSRPWQGVHVLMTDQVKTEQLTGVVGELAQTGGGAGVYPI